MNFFSSDFETTGRTVVAFMENMRLSVVVEWTGLRVSIRGTASCGSTAAPQSVRVEE
jgi:hypothetical protein